MSSLPGLLLKYLVGLVGISLVVVIHEAGHLILAWLNGIEVEVFSFGIGPRLFGVTIRCTDFRLSALPIGGYCRLKGSDDLSRALRYKNRTFKHIERGSYFAASPVRRILTYGGGVIANILFAILLYALLATLPFQLLSTEARIATIDTYPELFDAADSAASEGGLRNGDIVTALSGRSIADWEELEALLVTSEGVETFTVLRSGRELTRTVHAQLRADGSPRWGLTVMQQAIVGSVRTSSAEERAGLSKGDRIISVNSTTVDNHLDLVSALPNQIEIVVLGVEREGEERTITFLPERDETGRAAYRFSLESGYRQGERLPFSLKRGVWQSVRIARLTFDTLASLFRSKSADLHSTVTGVTRSALIIGDMATLGFEQNPLSGLHALLYLMGVVSISLAVINLVPLPAFDGGQITIALFEWVTGRPIPPRVYYIMQIIGFVMILGFFVVLGFSDLRYTWALTR